MKNSIYIKTYLKRVTVFTSVFLALLCSQSSISENIKIPVGSQTPELNDVARPKTGMTKTLVKSQFGEPVRENPAKGQPPISSWEYKDFIVYFESEHVIHSALKPIQHEATHTVIEETVEMKEDDLKLK